jgi:hypothetical protein
MRHSKSVNWSPRNEIKDKLLSPESHYQIQNKTRQLFAFSISYQEDKTGRKLSSLIVIVIFSKGNEISRVSLHRNRNLLNKFGNSFLKLVSLSETKKTLLIISQFRGQANSDIEKQESENQTKVTSFLIRFSILTL